MAWYPSTSYFDSMVKEYLSFRKLNSALKALDLELKSEKDKGFKVDKIVQHLLHFIHGYDVEGLTSYWTYLKDTFFNRFARYHLVAVEKYEADLYRLYMVHAAQNSKTKELQACLQKLTELDNLPGLKEWYSLLFSNPADTKSNFAPYFTRQWNETFLVSLHNFLSATFSCMPAPELMRSCVQDGDTISKLERGIKRLKAEKRKDSTSETMIPSTFSNAVYIQQLGKPSSLRRYSESRDRPKKGLSKALPVQKSPKERTESQEDFLSIETTASSSFGVNPLDQSPKSSVVKKPDVAIFAKKSQSLDVETISGRKDRESPSYTTSNSTIVTDNYGDGLVSRLMGDQQLSSSPEISYEKNIVLGMQQAAATSILSPIKTQQFVSKSRSAFLSDARSGLPMANPYSLSTGSPLTSEKDPFLVLSRDTFFEHHSSIVQCKFDNLGTSIASVDSQGVVKAWQSETVAKSFATVMMHSPIQCLEWCSKPTDTLILGTLNGTIRFFDVARNVTIKETVVDGAYCALTNIRLHPAGSSFVTSSVKPSDAKELSSQCSGQLMLWDIQPSNISLLRKIGSGNGASRQTTCLDYNHNGNLLVTGDVTGYVTLFDTKTCAVIHSAHAHIGSVCSVQFSSDETFVFSVGTDNELKAWDIHHLPKPPTRFDLSSASTEDRTTRPLLVLSPDGNHVLKSSGTKGVIYEISFSTHCLKTVLSLPEHKTPVTTLDWISSKACGHCLTGSADGRIHVTTLLLQ